MFIVALLAVLLPTLRPVAATMPGKAYLDILSNDTDIMIVSDIDDILRVTELWNPKRAIDNISRQPFKPVEGMDTLYHEYNNTIPGHIHFAYVTDAFKSFDKSYTSGLNASYPRGNITFRKVWPVDQFLNARVDNIMKYIKAFPHRKFILVGDFTTPGLTAAYATVARKNLKQVQCMWMLDVRANNPANHFCPATKYLMHKEVQERWTVFPNASDFRNASIDYIRRLAATNTTQNDKFGCGGMLDGQRKWNELADNKHYPNFKANFVTLTRGLAAQMQCIMLNSKRPHPACRFDRRDGTYYPAIQKFENKGKLEDSQLQQDPILVNDTKYNYMCPDMNGTYLGIDGCKFGDPKTWINTP